MLISQNELKKYGIDLTVKQLEDSLIQLGHEVEGVTSYVNDKLVVGYVSDIKKHENADTLNVCQVDIGNEILQIVCGAPNVGVGKYVIVALVNCILPGNFKIKKSKIRGVESFGMLCSISELGIDNNAITDYDNEGIYLFDKAVEIGAPALELIGFDDNILDLGLTANRGDCQSYTGVVRDLRALLKQKEPIEEMDIVTDVEALFEVTNQDDQTHFLSALTINNVSVKMACEDIRFFLSKHGIKPQNNIVDYANYTMLKTGIPMHTYDLDKLSGNIKTVVLKKAAKFIAIDEKEYLLPVGTLTIQDDVKIVAIASVIGSYDTRITNDTKNILVEIGHFDPVKVRKSATSIFKKTDASMRGEKSIDSIAIFDAYHLFNNLIKKEFNHSIISDIVFSNEIEVRSKLINLNVCDVLNVLGINIATQEIKSILDNLHFNLIEENEETLTYLVPTWRFDIFNDHDLIEEIIRVYSMDKITDCDVLSNFNLKQNIINDNKIVIQRELEKLVLHLGLNQVVTYSLVSEDELVKFGGKIDNAVRLMMPLSSLRTYYRQSLVPSLLETTQYNLDRQQDSVNIFEIANIYTIENGDVYEGYKLAGVVCGKQHNSYVDGTKNYDFYDLKGVVEGIFNHYNIEFEIKPAVDPHLELNPYVAADIYHKSTKVGFIGLKHSQYLKKIKEDVFVFEIELSLLDDQLDKKINYKKVTTNPSVLRDLTFKADKKTPFDAIVPIFDKIAHLKSIKLKDIYEGENIQDNVKAITLTLEFASDEITLTGEIVDKSVVKIVKNAEQLGFEFNVG